MKNNTVKILKVLKDADWCPLGFHKSLTDLYAGRNHSSKSKKIQHLFRSTPKKTRLLFGMKETKSFLLLLARLCGLLAQTGTWDTTGTTQRGLLCTHIPKLDKRKVQGHLSWPAVCLQISTIPCTCQGIGGSDQGGQQTQDTHGGYLLLQRKAAISTAGKPKVAQTD